MQKYPTLAIIVLIITLGVSGCFFHDPAGTSMPLKSSAVEMEYSTDPLEWLSQRTGKSTPIDRLSVEEAEQLCTLTECLSYCDPFFHSSELQKPVLIGALYVYYQGAFVFNDALGIDTVRDSFLYPPDGIQNIGQYSSRIYLSTEKAELFTQNLFGRDMPDVGQNYADEEDERIYCSEGVYFIYPGDFEYPSLTLRAYQPLGDGIFYLSFDGDDSALPGDPEKLKGNMKDYCRMLAKRSSSEWGFTILAKLKEGDKTLLPEDFPLPLYAA